jgi:hypothetical protein
MMSAVADNAERYQISDATIQYVSNIGAGPSFPVPFPLSSFGADLARDRTEHQWLFILGAALTAVFCRSHTTSRKTANPS